MDEVLPGRKDSMYKGIGIGNSKAYSENDK